MEQQSGWRCVEFGFVALVGNEDKSFKNGSPPVDSVSKTPWWFVTCILTVASHTSKRP